jgi:ankyrin repeat protein
MARVGFDLNLTDEDGATPLHWAAWHGQADAVRVLLTHGVKKDVNDRRFGAPPIGWCAHGSVYCRNEAGRYGEIAEALIQAGVVVPPGTEGSPEVNVVLKKHGITR